ncbi:MAG: isoaspartyl peptidase/L-asparaginase [Chloroflexi bacterium]|nr:isoaspartyl peptidase/L-asparaginase [Chloroflexota bacterium]
MIPAVIVHGGAWNIPNELVEAHRSGCRAAVLRAWGILQDGGSALDAVEAAVVEMEDDPTFDAGAGSFLNGDGQVELDAGLMDGATLAAGAVAAVHRVRNPITLARHVLQSEHVLIVGPGATRFAEKVGVPLCAESDLVVDRELARWRELQASSANLTEVLFGRKSLSTVGAVAVDQAGRIAAGTSTGGSLNKWPGRVGDVPLVGCGFYADNAGGGASCTGWGEAIMRVTLAKQAVDLMAAGHDAPSAARRAIHLLGDRVQGLGGIILIDREGRVGHASSTAHMACAYVTADRAEPVVLV